MKVASYRARGMFAGRVVEHRQVEGEQRWRIRVQTERADGQVDVHEVKPGSPLHIGALAGIVADTIAEVCGPGALLVDARMDFFVDKQP